MQRALSEYLEICRHIQNVASRHANKEDFIAKIINQISFRHTKELYEIWFKECLEKRDWKGLNSLIFQQNRLELIPGSASGYDHCIRFSKLLNSVACSDFEAVNKIIPQDIVASKNGYTLLVVGINLFFATWYKDEVKLEAALKAARKFINSKKPANERAQIASMVGICDKDPEAISENLQAFCTGYNKTDVLPYKKLLCMPAHGIYCLAKILLDEETFSQIKMPKHQNFSREFAAWRNENQKPELNLYFTYPEELEIFNQIFMYPPVKSMLHQPYKDHERVPYWYMDEKAMVRAFAKQIADKLRSETK
ncbi:MULTISPECIES: hypothetical protein [unclassified Campylobacter]|uniref:hypothetical protein n=1 Tax=unclassified Campylobacter TaxID=2593542 RepID=UPI001472B3B8|nr:MULTISPECIES: hypothetical protein [unclassified Campylobacter]